MMYCHSSVAFQVTLAAIIRQVRSCMTMERGFFLSVAVSTHRSESISVKLFSLTAEHNMKWAYNIACKYAIN